MEEEQPLTSVADPSSKVSGVNGHEKVVEVVDDKTAVDADSTPVETAKEKAKPRGPTISFSQLFRFSNGTDKIMMALGSLGAAALGVAMPIFSILFGNVMNSLAIPSGTNNITELVVHSVYYFIILGVASGFAAWLGLGMWMWVGERVAKQVRVAFFKAVLRQDLAWFDENKPGTISNSLASDTMDFSSGIGEKIATLIQQASMFLAGIAIGFAKGWHLTLLVLGVTPLMAIVGGFMSKVMMSATNKSQEAYGLAGTIAEETFSSVKTVSAFHRQQAQLERYSTHLRSVVGAGVKRSTMQGGAFGMFNLIMFGSYGLCMWFGVWLIRHKVVNPYNGLPYNGGDVMTVFFAIIIGAGALGRIAPSMEAIATARASAYRLYRVIDRVPPIDIYSTEGKQLTGVEEIRLEDVRFEYPSRPGVAVYDGLNMTVKSGMRVALVGSTGSGKSTIIGLLERFYDPTGGRVLINGVPLPQLNLKWWRSQVGLVSQEPVLFDGTVIENIRFGKPDATEEEVIAACKASNAHDFVMKLKNGYNSQVGEGGSRLSGGQKQRIAIARTIISSPAVLLLDEATSALDNESERLVQRALDGIMVGRTTFVVAHRLSTIVNSDRIYVLHQGQIVESGTHTELLAHGGAYMRLIKAQHQASDPTSALPSTSAALPSNSDNLPPAYSSKPEEVHKIIDEVVEGEGEVEDEAAVEKEKEKEKEKVIEKEEENAVNERLHSSSASSSSASASSSAVEMIDVDLNKEEDQPLVNGSGAKKSKKHKTKDHDKVATTNGEIVHIDVENVDTNPTVRKEKKKKGESKEEKAVLAPQVSVLRVWGLCTENLGFAALGFLAAVCNGSAMPLFALIFGAMSAVFYNPDPVQQDHLSMVWALSFFGLGVGMLLAGLSQEFGFGVVGQRLTLKLRTLAFMAIVRQEMGWFDEESHNSRILAGKLATEAALVEGGTTKQAGMTLQIIVTLTVGLIISFYYSWKVALVVLACGPILTMTGIVQMRLMTGFSSEGKKAFEGANKISGEAIGNMRTVASFAAEGRMLATYDLLLRSPLRVGIKKAHVSGLATGLSQLATFCVHALTWWFASTLVQKGELSFEAMMKSVFAIFMAAMSVGFISSMTPDMHRAGLAKNDMFALIDRKSYSDPFSTDGEKAHVSKGEIEFDSVEFAYPMSPTTPVLRGVSFKVAPGETVALVGPSGSGKSTIVSLLLRLYDLNINPACCNNNDRQPNPLLGGRILVDGADISQMNLESLRSHVGLVSQEPSLFDMSIEDNIKVGKPDATHEEVVAAATAANVHDFIHSLPTGYRTTVGTKGTQLSGGQKQRIAIARALIRQPKVLLLDEATSALDAESERVVQEALDKLMQSKERTIVVIAHRLSTVRHADKIAVLESGKLCEIGSHDQLMAVDGLYANLVKMPERA